VTKRDFTPAEANELLHVVRPIVERTVRHARVAAKIAGNGGGVRPHEVDELRAVIDSEAGAVAACVEELQSLGLLVKDLDEGLVDFPSRIGDEEVLLCWRLGEPEVAFWHGLDDGFAGRKPLS
jgi:hypothetical protein